MWRKKASGEELHTGCLACTGSDDIFKSWLVLKEKCDFSSLLLEHSSISNYIVDNENGQPSDPTDFFLLSFCHSPSFKVV